MKHTSLLLAATLFLANANLFANDAYMKVSGGSLLSVSKAKNENIKMEKEEINFTLHKDYYDVSVKFYFKNYGQSETVDVGFPQWKHLTPTDDIWINDILGGLDLSSIKRERNKIIITQKDVYPKIESEIILVLNCVPDILVSMRRINPEKEWYFRNRVIDEKVLTCYSDR